MLCVLLLDDLSSSLCCKWFCSLALYLLNTRPSLKQANDFRLLVYFKLKDNLCRYPLAILFTFKMNHFRRQTPLWPVGNRLHTKSDTYLMNPYKLMLCYLATFTITVTYTTQESENFQRSKCSVIVRIVQFVNTIIRSYKNQFKQVCYN